MQVVMKHIYKYILSLVVLFVPVLADAQDPPIYNEGYHIENGIATIKTVSETMDANGYYTLTLETFAIGATTISQKAIPSDIVLVLDLSTSMGGHRGTLTDITSSTALSYNEVENSDNNYVVWNARHDFGYQLFGLYRNNRYYLYFVSPGGTYKAGVWFLTGVQNGQLMATRTNPDGADITKLANIPNNAVYSNSPDGAIVTVTSTNNNGISSGNAPNNGEGPGQIKIQKASSRITELRKATSEFIDEIVQNDRKKLVNGVLIDRDEPLGNRLSIVTFSDGVMQSTDMLSFKNADNSLNTTNVNYFKSLAKNFTLRSGTMPASGLNEANSKWAGRSGTVGEDFLRTVVFFTDGKPDGSGTDDSNPTYANVNSAIAAARDSKVNYSATVFSVGLFGNYDREQFTRIDDFMNYVSSKYPEASSLTAPGPANSDGLEYYFDVSGGEESLSKVFKTIAQASGGSEKTVPSATQVVDGVTNSFTIPTPAGASAPTIASAQLTVYTRSINDAGTTWGSNQNLTLVEMTTEEEIQVPDPNKEYMSDASKVGVAIVDGKLLVMGFDYSKADSAGALDGNWVGWRYPDGTDASKTCAGKELVIQFKIQGDPDATGGDSTQTNTPDSGIYVPVYDESGKFVGYDPANQYELPHADIPINLVIIKEGLRHGESATIQIYRAPQSDVYNETTGKLKPYLPNGDDSWENFSKVILTNKGEDGTPVTETLLCLDPTYVYLMKEDDWGWSYNLVIEAIDTSMQEMNPFIFTNTEKTDAVRHAEAASFNRFGDDLHGRQRTETVKSSKVKTFITTPATGSGK